MHFTKEMGSIDESFSNKGYESKDYFFTETYVEFNQESMTEQRFPEQRFLKDVDYEDAAIGGMLFNAYREQVYHSQREGLSVCLSSSSMSERTGRPVGDRTVRPVEQRNQDAQIRTLLDKQKEQILAECQARIDKHEFQAAYDRRSLLKFGETVDSQREQLHLARAEEVQQRDQQLLQGQLLQQNLELRDAREKSLKEMEELKKFQSSTFDTTARRRPVEDQDTILELTGKIHQLYD